MAETRAWVVYLRGDENYRDVIFAESRDKARAIAMQQIKGCYKGKLQMDIFARRYRPFDGDYRGHAVMTWSDQQDRRALVREGWTCLNKKDCKNCLAREYCEQV